MSSIRTPVGICKQTRLVDVIFYVSSLRNRRVQRSKILRCPSSENYACECVGVLFVVDA